MPNIPRKYMWVNRKYFNTGLKPLDILILSRIEEETTHGRCCKLTNDEFSKMFGETLYAIKASISKLKKKELVTQKISYLSGNGKTTKQRYLVLNNEKGMANLEKHTERLKITD